MLSIEAIDQLNKDKLALVTVVTGDDLGQYAYLKEHILNRIQYDKEDLTYSYFDMSETDYQEAEMDLVTLPFFTDQKVVIFDHLLDITTSKKSYLDDKALKSLEDYLENPLDTTRLIIFASGKLDGKRRLVKILKRDAQIFEARQLKESEFKTYFQKQARQKALIFESGAFNRLLIKSNYDFSEMQKNLAFLNSYKGDGHISTQDIDLAIPKTLQDNIFDLTQFILNRKVDEARDLVRDLRLQGEDDIKLIAIMLGQFRMYLQVKLLSSQGKTDQQIVTSLSEYVGRQVNPYQVKYALRDSRSLSLSFLKATVVNLIKTDYAIKTGRYDKDYLFDVVLLKIINDGQNKLT